MKIKNFYDEKASTSKSIMDKYAVNINQQIINNKIDPIIGRDEEIRRVIRILSRKQKNNPVLIGEPGVGKTAVVEGLAQRIVKQDVPSTLLNKTIYSLNMASLIAGASLHGEFEKRLQNVIKYVQKHQDQIILFIDELHTIIGAGRTQGAMDAANILKPVLARGEVRCIGATTNQEHREYINKDPALERRFQKIFITEPTVEETINILRGLKKYYSIFHKVTILDEALVAAVKYSNLYITNRYLPDKAIDLVDEACSYVKSEIASSPVQLQELESEIINLEVEKSALQADHKRKQQQEVRLLEITQLLKQKKVEAKKFSDEWQKEKDIWNKKLVLEEKIEKLNRVHENAWRAGKFDIAGEIQYSKLPEIEEQLRAINKEVKDNTILKDEVNKDKIAKIVSLWTQIPIEKLLENEKTKLLKLEDSLKKEIFGQDEALKEITNAVIRAKVGIKDINAPIASFMFLGSTGVGKTEVVRAISKQLFGDVKSIIRLDMSEYTEKYSVSRLIGSAPGYIGYEKGGQLTEAVLKNPYSIILFDEIEKAHPDVSNILLQLLDEGRLTDGLGRTVDFKNCLIFLTSNLGSEEMLNQTNEKINLYNLLQKKFSVEFINRIDNVVMFKSLSKENAFLVINKFLQNINDLLEDKNISLTLTENAKNWIYTTAYDSKFGMRGIKRYMEKEIKTLLAFKLLKNQVQENSNYFVDILIDKFVLNLNKTKILS